jgi:SAM-dependent methyltransferase/uncharacterized protein YbaR (Trm112 family)
LRRRHFEAFAPICPSCAAHGRGGHPLAIAHVAEETDGDVVGGTLQCTLPACRHEFPIVDGIPVIVPNLAAFLSERATEILLRADLDPVVESLVGDALGQGSWFDIARQTLSTYGWDGWADQDPLEIVADDGPRPGTVRRCLARLLDAVPAGVVRRALDLGCAAGRSSWDLAEHHPEALVLGVDINLALLRLARGALSGTVSYPRRRIGIVYDQRIFPVPSGCGDRIDFWACDALAPPFAAGAADLAVALNLLDCVAEPARLLAQLVASVRPGGRILLATPYDWSTRATPIETWIGGHSQRADHAGAAEPFLLTLLTEHAHPSSIAGVRILAETAAWPWQTRLHDRASVAYRCHLLALERTFPPRPTPG